MPRARAIATAALLLALLGSAAACIGPGRNSEVETSPGAGLAFPRVSGIDLEGGSVELPAGFEGRVNLVAVAFQRAQQADVDTWIDAADELIRRHPELRFYEVPVIYRSNPVWRAWINNGMRQGVRAPEARRRTITLYVDREAFTASLAIPDLDSIHVFLLDAGGAVLWRATGPVSDEAIASLLGALTSAR